MGWDRSPCPELQMLLLVLGMIESLDALSSFSRSSTSSLSMISNLTHRNITITVQTQYSKERVSNPVEAKLAQLW